MTKYHVNSLGVLGVCHAEKTACPFGNTFDNIEDAEKFQEVNKKVFSRAADMPSTESIIHRTGKMPNKGYSRIRYMLQKAEKDVEKYKNPKTKEDKKRYEKAKRQRGRIYRSAQRIEGERYIAHVFKNHFDKEDIVNVNYSAMSSSTYIYLKSDNFNKAIEVLKKMGIRYEARPDAIDHLGEYFEIRFANHKPPEYKNAKSYWSGEAKPTFLAEYPEDVRLKKLTGKDMIKYLNKKTYQYTRKKKK